MTTDERIFRSTRVTQIPSFGIVQGTGFGAQAQTLRNAAGVFDQVAEFANKKLDEKAFREARLQAEEDVRSAGLNPAELDDPITVADNIYREAAINAYTIKVEDDLNTTVSRFALEESENPQAFLAKAKGYVSGKIENLPAELRTPFEKEANALVSSNALSIQKFVREKVLSETKALNEAKLDEYTQLAINAGPEEREVYLAKALAVVAADATISSPELKQAKAREFENNFLIGAMQRDVAVGALTPRQALDDLRSAGVGVTPALIRSVYNSYGIQEEFENRKAAQAKAQTQAQADIVETAVYARMLAEEGLSEQEFVRLREQAAKTLLQMGAPERALKFRQTASDQYYGVIIDSPEVISDLQELVDNTNPEAEAQIDAAVALNVLGIEKARKLKAELQENRGSVGSSRQWKEFSATYLLSKYPLGFYTEAQISTLSPERRAEAEKQIATIKNYELAVNQRVNNVDPAQRVSVNVAISELQSQMEQRPNPVVNSVPADNPRFLEVQNLLLDQKPVYKFYDPMAKGIERVQQYTIDDLKAAPEQIRERIELFRGPFSPENYRRRLSVMLAETRKYYEQNPDGMHPPYDFDLMQGIAQTYGARIEDIMGDPKR